MSRAHRQTIAKDTLDILERGSYKDAKGINHNISHNIQDMIQGTVLYGHDHVWPELPALAETEPQTTIEVVASTTLEACEQLLSLGEQNVLVLNFASGKNAGGGFLGGSQAQEESLARSSALYISLTSPSATPMYKYNRGLKPNTGFYSHFMVYSPRVPVLRKDDGTLLEKPYLASFISAPAVNAGHAMSNKTVDQTPLQREIDRTMAERIARILHVAWHHKHHVLVLGAYGTGVFKNRPQDVARLFKEALSTQFKNRFRKVLFAIYDKPGGETISAFENAFSHM